MIILYLKEVTKELKYIKKYFKLNTESGQKKAFEYTKELLKKKFTSLAEELNIKMKAQLATE